MPTIVPLTLEEQWLPLLHGVAPWNLPMVPTLVIAPHPDDETLGAGGLIARLRSEAVPVSVAAITDGEGAYADAGGLGALRALEQIEALHRLGVPEAMVHRFHLPDRYVTAQEDKLVDLLLPLASEGMHIVAPWQQDFHPDHEAAGRAAGRVARARNLPLTSYLFWTWHRGTPALLEDMSLAKLPLTGPELATKLHALEAHHSQFEHPDGQPILSADLLAPAQRPFEVYIR